MELQITAGQKPRPWKQRGLTLRGLSVTTACSQLPHILDGYSVNKATFNFNFWLSIVFKHKTIGFLPLIIVSYMKMNQTWLLLYVELNMQEVKTRDDLIWLNFWSFLIYFIIFNDCCNHRWFLGDFILSYFGICLIFIIIIPSIN